MRYPYFYSYPHARPPRQAWLGPWQRAVVLVAMVVVLFVLAGCSGGPKHQEAPLTRSRLTTVADDPVIPSSNSFDPDSAIGWRQETLLKTLGEPDYIGAKEDGHVFQYSTRHCVIDFIVLPVRGRTQVSSWQTRNRQTGGPINISVCSRQLRDRIGDIP